MNKKQKSIEKRWQQHKEITLFAIVELLSKHGYKDELSKLIEEKWKKTIKDEGHNEGAWLLHTLFPFGTDALSVDDLSDEPPADE